jgi:excisionase family DNA binding protein
MAHDKDKGDLDRGWPERPRVPRASGTPHGRSKPLLSVEETAELLGQSRSSLYRAIATGSLPLPVLNIGGRYRIARVAVERLIEGDWPSTA